MKPLRLFLQSNNYLARCSAPPRWIPAIRVCPLFVRFPGSGPLAASGPEKVLGPRRVQPRGSAQKVPGSRMIEPTVFAALQIRCEPSRRRPGW